MINHDKYMMINFSIFYEFLYEKYYFLRKKKLKIWYENYRNFLVRILKIYIKRKEQGNEKIILELKRNSIKKILWIEKNF